MAMTVLPSFQTFLQSAAQTPRPLSPLQPQSPVLTQPRFQFYFQAPAPPQQQFPSGGHRSPLASPSTSDLRIAAIQDTHLFAPAVWKTSPLSATSSSSSSASRSCTGVFSCSSEDDVDEDDEEICHQDQRQLQRARARAESFVYRHRASSPSNGRRYAAPMATSFAAASPASTSSTSTGSVDSSSSGAKRVKKKYLKERERCEIVRRVRAGEKQAHLAKEFGVSRAAVCYLLKHQMEILRRSAQRL